MANSFSVRPIQEGDQESIYTLLKGDESTIPKEDPRHPARYSQTLIQSTTSPGATGGGWLAIADGKAVGMITTKDFDGGVVVEKDYSSAGSKGYKGIGATLVTAREDFMRAHGQTEARADIKATNATSLHLFSKLGYQFDDASRAKLKAWQEAPDNTDVPVLVLTKKLTNEGFTPPAAS